MADRVYPSKPNPQPPSAAAANGGGANTAFPATKAQLYGANRPMYRPQQPKQRRRSRRGCCCIIFLWTTLILLGLILLAAIAGGIFYVLYRPHRPTFSVTTLRLSTFNISSANSLASRLDLAVTARNPNKKLVFLYDDMSISAFSNGVSIADGSIPAFVQDTKNTTVLNTTLTSSSASSQTLDATTASDLRNTSSLPLEIDLETKAGVKIGSLKTKKIRIRVSCSGISVAVPKGKAATAAAAASPDASCTVKIRIKIWKWTL